VINIIISKVWMPVQANAGNKISIHLSKYPWKGAKALQYVATMGSKIVEQHFGLLELQLAPFCGTLQRW
jgi:hypothetical protein